MEILEIRKDQLIKPMDLTIVPMDYKAKIGECVYQVYIGGDIPIKVMSRTITKVQFRQICES